MPGMPFPKQSKPLHIFYPRMIDLQVEYTAKRKTGSFEIHRQTGRPAIRAVV